MPHAYLTMCNAMPTDVHPSRLRPGVDPFDSPSDDRGEGRFLIIRSGHAEGVRHLEGGFRTLPGNRASMYVI